MRAGPLLDFSENSQAMRLLDPEPSVALISSA